MRELLADCIVLLAAAHQESSNELLKEEYAKTIRDINNTILGKPKHIGKYKTFTERIIEKQETERIIL